MWDAQMPELHKHFRVLRYDTRGHGQSEVTPGPYSFEQLGRDVLALADETDIGNFSFCGLSMGVCPRLCPATFRSRRPSTIRKMKSSQCPFRPPAQVRRVPIARTSMARE